MADADHDPHFPTIEPLVNPPGGPPPVEEFDPAARDLATDDVLCRHCGFNLRGLRPEWNCPECGAPIQRSLGGDHLVYSSKEYVRSLYRGLIYILVATIASMLWSLVLTVISTARSLSQVFGGGSRAAPLSPASFSITGSPVIDLVLTIVSLPIAVVVLYGWWLFSSRDPQQRYGDIGEPPRRIVRSTVFAMAALSAVSTAIMAITIAIPQAIYLQMGIAIPSLLVAVAQFFATLFYIRWMAPRLPSEKIRKRAELYMWLLPVIYLVGSCLVVGPLVATILFLLLLNQVRVALRGVVAKQEDNWNSNSTDRDST